MNGGFEVLEIAGEGHPDGAWDGSSFGDLSGALELDRMIGA
jgi:hypothetical protein